MEPIQKDILWHCSLLLFFCGAVAGWARRWRKQAHVLGELPLSSLVGKNMLIKLGSDSERSEGSPLV